MRQSPPNRARRCVRSSLRWLRNRSSRGATIRSPTLISQSPRIAAVQRALSEYGYAQLKPSGILDDATSKAIEKFEREHKLPVTGRVTDRLVAELAGLVGHPIE